MDNSLWDFFALVCYVPEPLHSFIQALRRALPGEHFPQPHLTLLPPRSLHVPADEASDWARSVLLQFTAFPVQLSSVQTFEETNVLYLSASDAERKLFQAHRALNSGPLFEDEQFEFRPHLTLGGPIDPAQLGPARDVVDNAWVQYKGDKQFIVDELVALGGVAAAEQDGRVTWNRLWTYSLSSSRWKTAGA